VVLPACEATGPCKARALAHQLWEGEEFHLQVDAHMRFAAGWDDALLRALSQAQEAAGHPRVVLSAYPPGYEVRAVVLLGKASFAALLQSLLPACLAPGSLRFASRARAAPAAPPLRLQGAGGDATLPPPPLPAVLCAAGWGQQDGLLRLRARKLRQPLAAPAPALFWAAGLSFSRAQLLVEVRADACRGSQC
jgi:hypothetical protein